MKAMFTGTRLVLSSFALSSLLMSTAGHATESVADAMTACSAKSNSLQRLVCYDKIAARLNDLSDSTLPATVVKTPALSSATAPNVPTVAAPSQSTTTAPVQSKSMFGFAEKESDESVVATITKLSTDSRNYMTFTLDNGQVWKQTEVNRIRFKEGDTVEIEEGRFSGFYLSSTNNNRSTNVKRLK